MGKSNLDKKIVQFCIEINFHSFELSFTPFELNDFLNCITEVTLACLCLNSLEKEMLIAAILQPVENIISFQNHVHAKKYLDTIYNKNTCIIIIENMTTVLVHYNAIVLILHKFKSLVNPESIIEENQNIINQN